MAIARREILKLYKDCLVYVNSLKYTDKDYLRDRLRNEFRQHISEDKLDFHFKKGLAFLERDRLA